MMIDLKNLKPFRYELYPKGRKPKKPAKQDTSQLKGADAKPMIVEEASHD
jgi:hypothetical protein